MPAVVRHYDGAKVRSEFWLRGLVSRIGSHIDADISVPSSELEELIAVLEYSGGLYLLHNQTQRTLQLGGSSVAPNSSAPWLPGDDLFLGQDVTLQLIVEIDSRPTGEPAAFEDEDEEYDEADDLIQDQSVDVDAGDEPSKAVQIAQIAVIVLCFVGIVAIIAVKFLDIDIGTQPERSVKVSDLLGNIQEAESNDASIDRKEILRRLAQLIKFGELERGRSEESQYYYQVRQMIPLLTEQAFLPEQTLEDIKRHVTRRLKSDSVVDN